MIEANSGGITSRVRQSLERVLAWVDAAGNRGYEPADGNLSLLHALTGKRVLPMRVLQQVVLRAPFNIRPLLGIRPHASSIGRGYVAWGCSLASSRGDDLAAACRARALDSFEWLLCNRAPGYDDLCWGDPYDYATRSGRRPLGEPLLVWSALIGQAFLEGYERFRDERFLRAAVSVRNWVMRLPAERTRDGVCLSYVAYGQSSIHNSNLMGAAFLARVGALARDDEALAVARAAAAYSCAAQGADGAWWYAEEPKFHWVDNFHTGYNLWALRKYRDHTGDRSFDASVIRGLRYYTAHFFEADGRPRYFDTATYPVDIQCAAQAIDTLTTFADEYPDCLPLAERVADWTIRHMQAPNGHFYYRDLGWTIVKTPMFHWGQGTMIKALATLLSRLEAAPAQLASRDAARAAMERVR